MNKAVKSCLSAFALLLPFCVTSTNHSGEYFWNTDPGVGRALKIAVTDVGADGIMQTTLNASGLNPGMNVLGMRVFNGRWSPTVIQYVFQPIDPTSLKVSTCEYWWDSDPGIDLGKKLTIDIDDTGISIADFDAADLTPGIHTLGFRTDINGMWSPTVTRYVFVPMGKESIDATKCEYWWDRDPGIGQCPSSINIDKSNSNAIDLNLTAEGLTPGIHLLGMRVFNGLWSPTVVQYVFVPQDPAAITEATCEYWWDSDPGIDLGKKLTVATGGTGILAVDFEATDLTPGIHTLGFRTGINGMWSPTVTRHVFVPQDPASITSTTCEYWWDSDPGVGLCENTVTASTSGCGAIDLNLKAEGLTPGMHMLGIRSNINGQWSTTVTAPVFVRDNIVAVIDAVEYFWGDDPGFGKGTPLEIKAAESIAFENLVFDFPTEEQTEYVLTIRAHSSIGGWGYSLVKVFTPVEATGIIIDPSEFRFGYPGQEMAFTAVSVPSNAWIDGFLWESSDSKIATVDDNGCVKSVAEGECVITARIKGTDFIAESKILVDNEDRYPLGDSNGSMNVSITDVATTVGYVLGTDISKFIFRAADVTSDNEISVADAVGTVNIIFGLPVAKPQARAMAKKDAGLADISRFCLMPDGSGLLTIDLDNTIPLTAMQFDLRLPDGIEIASVGCGRRAADHKGVFNRQPDGSYRVVVYSAVNALFSGNEGSVVEIVLTSDGSSDTASAVACAYDLRVVECNSIEHSLPDIEAEISELSDVEAIDCNGLVIYTEGQTLHIVSPQATRVIMSTIDGIVRTLEVNEGDNAYAISMPGVYIVNGTKILIN